MIEREARIVNPLGMHARPAAELVKVASRFTSSIQVGRGELMVNAKSIMGVMMLAAELGSMIRLRAEGDDAEAAVAAVLELVAAGFHEMHLTGDERDLEDEAEGEPV